jgi:hypothetical protein
VVFHAPALTAEAFRDVCSSVCICKRMRALAEIRKGEMNERTPAEGARYLGAHGAGG